MASPWITNFLPDVMASLAKGGAAYPAGQFQGIQAGQEYQLRELERQKLAQQLALQKQSSEQMRELIASGLGGINDPATRSFVALALTNPHLAPLAKLFIPGAEKAPHAPTGTPTTGGFKLNKETREWEPYQPFSEKSPKAPSPNYIQSQAVEALTERLGRTPTAQEIRNELRETTDEKNKTEEQLTRGALRGNREDQRILDAMQRRRLEIADKQAKQQFEARTEGVDIPSISRAITGGQQALSEVKNTFGAPISARVNTEVLKQYPRFNFILAEANAKWSTNPGNLRTIAMLEGALPRVTMLADQLTSLPNKNFPAINAAMRQVATQTGKPEYAAFESNRNAIVQEINTALSGSATGSDLRVKIELENLNASRSPAQLIAAIGNLKEAMLARLDPSMSPLYPLEVIRGEKTPQQYIAEIRSLYKGQRGSFAEGGARAGGGALPSAVPSPLKGQRATKSDGSVLSDGTYTMKDGSTVTVKGGIVQ